MKAYDEQLAEVKELIRRNPSLEVVETKEVIAEDDNRLLVRVAGAMKLDGKWWPTLNHELWTDKEKFRQGIPSEVKGRTQCIYMVNITGSTEDILIEYFNRHSVKQ